MTGISATPIDPPHLLAGFTAGAGPAGAVVSFTGIVRADDDVEALWLDHHDRMTPAAIERLAADARERFALSDILVVHRVGRVEVGQPIVFVAAAAPHRRAAFDAVDFVMDALKTRIPLWKRETSRAGTRWVEPRVDDRHAAARWEMDIG